MQEKVMPQEFYIIFDGPPGPDGPRFIDVENAQRQSIKAGEWKEEKGTGTGFWRFGPFVEAVPGG